MRMYIVYSYRVSQSYITFCNFSVKRNVRRDSVIWKNVEKQEKGSRGDEGEGREAGRKNICAGHSKSEGEHLALASDLIVAS